MHERDLDYDTPFIPGTVVGELVDLLIADGSDVGAAGDRSLGELIDTLHDSGRGLVVDWRAQLADVLETMRTQLSPLGMQMDYAIMGTQEEYGLAVPLGFC